MHIEVVVGDITRQKVEAVVTAANQALVGGGGVDRAVHRVAGPELVQSLRPLAPCPAGSAVVTPAFGFPPPVRWVVHAVGPVYSGADADPDVLASAYRTAIRCCDQVGARSVAFPSISTGAYGYPQHEAVLISVEALVGVDTAVEECLLVALDEKTARRWQRALGERRATRG